MSDPVRVERNGPVTTVILNRPEARNAVNGPTAAAPCRPAPAAKRPAPSVASAATREMLANS